MTHDLSDSDREYLRSVAASWGPPTPEQRARLRPLLQGTIPATRETVANPRDEAA